MDDKKYLINNKKLMQEWDYTKNIINPEELTIGSGKKVWWLCPKGHSYSAIVYSRSISNSNCPYCTNQKILKGFNDLATLRPDILCKWNYQKNNAMNIFPEDIGINSSKKVSWICSKGHEFDCSIIRMTADKPTNCPICSGRKIIVGLNDFETWCKKNNRYDLINEFDKEKNNFTMQEITAGSGKIVWWICPNGHSYNTYLTHRTGKLNTGCGYCSNKRFLKGHNDLLTTNPEIANEWDYQKNVAKPDEVMAGSNNKKYWFLCEKGHSYRTTLLARKKGQGCPICSKERHISFPEKALFYYLSNEIDEIEENFHDKSILGNKELDIYLKQYKIGIEYDGKIWHKNIKRDLEKDKICCSNGITLIRIREDGCPEYESRSIKIRLNQNTNIGLENAIYSVIEFLNNNFNIKIKADIDIERDRIKIYELLELYEKENSILNKCPLILEYWDYEYNGTLKPDQLSYSSLKKIGFKCKNGHKWIDEVRNFYRMQRCLYCSGERILKGYNDLVTTHPHLIKEWSNKNKISIYNVSYGSQQNIIWHCSKCNSDYTMKISDKTLKNNQCPYCSGHRVLKGYNDLATTHPYLIKEWSDKNKIKIDQVTFGSSKKIIWKCLICSGEYERLVSARTGGDGCPYCSGHRVLKGYNDLESQSPEIAKDWNYEKNVRILPSEFANFSGKEVWWKCHICGNEWKAKIATRTKGKNKCPNCSQEKKEIVCIETQKVYKNFITAERETGINRKCISACCNGKMKSAGKYHWEYLSCKKGKLVQ